MYRHINQRDSRVLGVRTNNTKNCLTDEEDKSTTICKFNQLSFSMIFYLLHNILGIKKPFFDNAVCFLSDLQKDKEDEEEGLIITKSE